MTSKLSSAPWVDEPFHLIPTPSKRLTDSHSSLYCASEMANAHNVMIRGLNSIIHQAPCISAENGSTEKDVKDLFFYIQSWIKLIHHHHHVEESLLFPEIEKFSGKPGLMHDPKHEHELFHDGMEQLMTYTSTTKPQEYRWERMKEIIDSFSEPLTNHLHAEIDVFLALKDVDSKGLAKIWSQGETLLKQTGMPKTLYDVFPFVLGCADRTYEGNNSFPPLPWIVPYLIKYWFGLGNGAWRFCPCDWWGRPRPLAFTQQKSL
ncbi:hypothetical protein F5Y04DRAFT_278761 [Hypomontagnella monticulosa]|nr:hypothetical protein F5Y04DRAFT_278761 [Hypomontagnella monticulosa]